MSRAKTKQIKIYSKKKPKKVKYKTDEIKQTSISLVSVTFEPNRNIQIIKKEKKRARQIAKNNIIKKRTKKTEKKNEKIGK